MSQTIHRIDRLTNWLLAAIVIIPFVLSATALNDLAYQHGQRPSWLYPIMVDGGLIIFKLLVLRAALRGQRDRYAWTMAVTATAISVGLNVHHAEANLTARLMAALPPLAILAAFVAVTRRVEETAVEEGHIAQRASLQTELHRLAADLSARQQEYGQTMAALQANYDQERTRLEREIGRLTGQIETLRQQKAALQADKPNKLVDKPDRPAATAVSVNGHAPGQPATGQPATGQPATRQPATRQPATGQPDLTARQQQILAMLRQDIGQADMAATLGVSERTVRREIGRLNGLAHPTDAERPF
jgi:DNA-binding CsgD family transcriptional regulator